jgi:predicted short-subunit dehydrogenase-like oxidoreductase (DUF2520 family)
MVLQALAARDGTVRHTYGFTPTELLTSVGKQGEIVASAHGRVDDRE